MKKILGLALALMMVLSMAACGSKDAASAGYKDGTYSAVADGNNGEVTVEVVVEGGNIKSVAATAHEETPGLGDVALEKVAAAIVEAQSAEVDTVSGATNSSKAMISAVTEILASAK